MSTCPDCFTARVCSCVPGAGCAFLDSDVPLGAGAMFPTAWVRTLGDSWW